MFYKSRNYKDFFPNLFYLIILLLALLVNQISVSEKGADVISRAATSISQADGSVGKRIRYYQDVFNHFISNPIVGVGIGNWKISSIHYDRQDIDGYIVPYHAHSDFIQLGAELGIIGFILYLGIFVLAFYYSLIILFKSSLDNDNKWFIFFLTSSLGIYFIDANLNFPIARPQVLAPWALTISLLAHYYGKVINKDIRKNIKIFSFFPLLSILAMTPSVSIKYYL